ncbi:MAG: hypothetical protein IJ272_03170 [Clostridia bacterium]|nr:hypothetical protein [Clostridia bacterium]
MKDNMDKMLSKKYLDIQTPGINLDNLNKRKNYTVYKVAIVLLVAIMVTIGIRIINENKYEQDVNNELTQDVVAENNVELPEAIGTIQVRPKADWSSFASMDVDYVVILKVNKILGYTNYSKLQEEYTLPITKLQITVKESLKGKISGTMEINKPGGVVSMADWEKTLTEEQKEKQGYNDMTQEEKEKTFMYVFSSVELDIAKPEEGKTYVALLREDNVVYDELSIIAFMAEYDEDTNKIKVNSKWENINDNFYIKTALKNK